MRAYRTEGSRNHYWCILSPARKCQVKSIGDRPRALSSARPRTGGPAFAETTEPRDVRGSLGHLGLEAVVARCTQISCSCGRITASAENPRRRRANKSLWLLQDLAIHFESCSSKLYTMCSTKFWPDTEPITKIYINCQCMFKLQCLIIVLKTYRKLISDDQPIFFFQSCSVDIRSNCSKHLS